MAVKNRLPMSGTDMSRGRETLAASVAMCGRYLVREWGSTSAVGDWVEVTDVAKTTTRTTLKHAKARPKTEIGSRNTIAQSERRSQYVRGGEVEQNLTSLRPTWIEIQEVVYRSRWERCFWWRNLAGSLIICVGSLHPSERPRLNPKVLFLLNGVNIWYLAGVGSRSQSCAHWNDIYTQKLWIRE